MYIYTLPKQILQQSYKQQLELRRNYVACLVQQHLDLHLPLDQNRDAGEHCPVILHIAGNQQFVFVYVQEHGILAVGGAVGRRWGRGG